MKVIFMIGSEINKTHCFYMNNPKHNPNMNCG